jgi:putative cell wall-binding protein
MSTAPVRRLRLRAASTFAIFTTLLLFVGVLVVAPAAGNAATAAAASAGIVKTADLSKFEAGNIINDAVFFDRGTMSAPQIQSFLEAKVPVCRSGYTCLKDWYDTSRTTTADAMCGPYAGGIRERASTIIYKVAQACGINPQVILATLQKEQGLVLHTWPSEWRYTIAMGQGCPDTAACDTRYYGFFNQVYGAAWQFKRYANPPGTSQYYTWYAPGKTWNIRYHPNVSCGSSPVYVQNQATANLYYYTPYQPNAAALAAGSGEGDACSAYGNRNFYRYFIDWFGSTQVVLDPCRQPDEGTVAAGAGEFSVAVSTLNARIGPSTQCEPVARTLAMGTVVTRTGVYGDWWRVRLDGVSYWVFGPYLAPAPPVGYATQRLAGADRFETAVAVAKQTHPSGAQTVFLASGRNFPDALSGSALAARNSAPLLLVEPGGLPPVVATQLMAFKPSRVVLLGGEATISASVASAVSSVLGAGVTVERIAGADRYQTSLAMARSGWGSASSAYLATGRGFADALSASAVAAAQGAPVILVDGVQPALGADVVTALGQLGVKSVVIAGGPVSISEGIAAQLGSLGISVDRKGGADRYETSSMIASTAYPAAAPKVLIASGADFPDALAGAVLAGQQRLPLFATPPACMVGTIKDYLITHATTMATLLGGPAALTDSVLGSVRC